MELQSLPQEPLTRAGSNRPAGNNRSGGSSRPPRSSPPGTASGPSSSAAQAAAAGLAPGAAQLAASPPCCWLLPAKCANRICPSAVQTLRQFGYDQILVIRSPLNIFLWLSSLISLGFVAVWFSDLTSMNCASAQLGPSTHMPVMHCAYCASEVIGILIFFGSFTDSIRMIAHFDDENQSLLKKREQQLTALAKESERALTGAFEHIKSLRTQVIKDMKEAYVDYLVEVFNMILPRLMESVAPNQRKLVNAGKMKQLRDVTCIRKFAEQLRHILEEPGELTQAFIEDLRHEHPELVQSKEFCELLQEAHECFEEALDDWDDWLASTCPGINHNVTESPSVSGWRNSLRASLSGLQFPDLSSLPSLPSLHNPFHTEDAPPPVLEAAGLTATSSDPAATIGVSI